MAAADGINSNLIKAAQNTDPGHGCAQCGKAALLSCTACKDFPIEEQNEHGAIRYCSKDCQRLHWTKHKHECKTRTTRKIMYRAAKLALDIFLHFCERTWGEKVISIKDQGDLLIIHVATLEGNVHYVPFPDMSAFSAKDKAAVLSHSVCNVAISSLWKVIEVLFEGQSLNIREVIGKVYTCQRQTLMLPGQAATQLKHQLWQVQDKSGKLYALDLDSAQFGYYQPITPWDVYQKLTSYEIETTAPGGTTKQGGLGPEWDYLRLNNAKANDVYGEAAARSIKKWESLETGMKIAKLLRLSQKDFDERGADLVQLCDDFIATWIDQVHKDNLTIVDGMSLITAHPSTQRGASPYTSEAWIHQYKAGLAREALSSPLIFCNALAEIKAGMTFENKQYQEMTPAERILVNKCLKGDQIWEDSRFSFDGRSFQHDFGGFTTLFDVGISL